MNDNYGVPCSHNPKVPGSSPGSATKEKEKCATGAPISTGKAENSPRMIEKNSIPQVKLVTCGMDLKKRWYITFWWSLNGRKKRYRYYGDVNRIKRADLRLAALKNLQQTIFDRLASGWNPETDMYNDPQHLTIADALAQCITVKKGYVMPTTFSSFQSRVRAFIQWLNNEKLALYPPSFVKKQEIIKYLNWLIGRGINSRTRNNHLADIKECFTMLSESHPDEIIANPCTGIRKLPERSVRHEAYTNHEFKRISELVRVVNPYLHLFCRIIVYCGLRPIEITRLRVGDFNLDERIINLPGASEKNAERRVLRIFDVLWKDIEAMGLQHYPSHYYIFNSSKQPREAAGTRDWFTRQFSRVRKELNLAPNKTMYAIRHTFICDLLENGEDPLTVMKISGHKSWDAFKQYADKYLKKPVDDFSSKLTTVF